MKYNIISCDLGATKCATALVEYNKETEQYNVKSDCTVKLRDVKSLPALIEKIEADLGHRFADVDAICIGGAGQYDGDTLHLATPYPYPMQFAKLAKQENWPKFAVVHDYTPIICATFTQYISKPGNIKWLHQGKIHPYGRRIAMGVGTGLGVKDGILFPDGRFWLGINEMGHIGISNPPLTQPDFVERHLALINTLRSKRLLKKSEPLTFEKLLSGDGLVRIYKFISGNKDEITAKEVSELIQTGNANETLATFAWYLGLFIGTLQLTFMPVGGIWITGGVALRNLNVFDHPDFYQGIHASPAYQAERASFPVGVMINSEHAYVGGAYYAAKRLLDKDMGLGLIPGINIISEPTAS